MIEKDIAVNGKCVYEQNEYLGSIEVSIDLLSGRQAH